MAAGSSRPVVSCSTSEEEPVPDLSPRRRALLAAAAAVLAREGSRGLTHRAVDREAGLPQGTCSAYLRTRAALVDATAGFVTESLGADVGRLAARLPDDGAHGTAEELVLSLFTRWLRQPDLLLARLELTLIAGRDPALAERLRASRDTLTSVVAQALGRRGPEAAEAAETLVAALDGVLLGALLLPGRARAAYLRRSVHRVVEGLGAGSAPT